jgi:regulation of enolase protein 1 (concanavalin A-like superfamily)
MRHVAAVLVCCVLLAAAPAAPAPPSHWWAAAWKTCDPDKDCRFERCGGGLAIALPGKDHRFFGWTTSFISNIPYLVREVEGDFVAEVRVSGSFRPLIDWNQQEVACVGAGLLVVVDDDDKTTFTLQRLTVDRGYSCAHFIRWCETRGFAGYPQTDLAGDVRLWLRLERRRDRVVASYHTRRKPWVILRSLVVKLPPMAKVGVFAETTSSAAFKPQFDQFRLSQPAR